MGTSRSLNSEQTEKNAGGSLSKSLLLEQTRSLLDKHLAQVGR